MLTAWKKTGILLLVVLILALLFLGLCFKMEAGKNVSATLIVNGKEITTNYSIRKNTRIVERGAIYGYIPFFTVLRQLGYSAEWRNDGTAAITIDDQQFIYRDEGLYRVDGNDNYLVPPPGWSVFPLQREEDELFTTTNALLFLMENIGVRMAIDVDINTREIRIQG